MKSFFMRSCTSLVLALFAFNLSASEKKVALIWGNASYFGQWQPLNIVKNDANTMDRVFKSLGFETKLLPDGNLNEMKSSLKEFALMAKNADIAVFYYSGHATRINDGYYIIPAKTQLGNDMLTSDLLPAQDIITALRSSRLRLLFFDACRDDAAIEGVSKGNPNIVVANDVGPGTNYDSKSPSGTMLCYASERGKKAYTGSGSLSIFTKVLSEHLADGDEFRTVWANIINDVYLIQKQRPVNDGFYQHDLYLNPVGRKHNAPTQNIAQSSSQVKTSTTNGKKSISIVPNVSGATIDFYGTKYEAGIPLSFDIGKSYTYTISANGYKSFMGSLDVIDSTPSTINITMQKSEPASFRITSNTSANVFLDGELVGTTPITINTISGSHKLSLSARRYYGYTTNIDLEAGSNSQNISLTRKPIWFFERDDADAPADIIGYSFSPKYQIGLQYLRRFEDTQFLLGASVALSTGLFRGWDYSPFSITQNQSVSISLVSAGGGNTTTSGYQDETSYINGAEESYSSVVDPYNEAKHYDASALLLANFGYNICNGIILELGVGAGYHRDLYYMEHAYTIKKTTRTNTLTGEVTEMPDEYFKQSEPKWYKENGKWSPAFRFGTKFLIPLNHDDEYFISLGCGYSFLTALKKYNSFDFNVGFCWAY